MLALATSYTWCRDLITTPAEDLGPQHLAAEAKALAEAHGAAFTLIQVGQGKPAHCHSALLAPRHRICK